MKIINVNADMNKIIIGMFSKVLWYLYYAINKKFSNTRVKNN